MYCIVDFINVYLFQDTMKTLRNYTRAVIVSSRINITPPYGSIGTTNAERKLLFHVPLKAVHTLRNAEIT